MCERVDYSMPIGNVYDGIDFKAIVNVMKKYNKKCAEKCGYCPLYKACPVCYSTLCLDEQVQEKNCNNLIENFRMLLVVIYSILEINPNAFDIFENKIEWALNR